MDYDTTSSNFVSQLGIALIKMVRLYGIVTDLKPQRQFSREFLLFYKSCCHIVKIDGEPKAHRS